MDLNFIQKDNAQERRRKNTKREPVKGMAHTAMSREATLH